jgi:Zn-finger nucleic acid-binding protein
MQAEVYEGVNVDRCPQCRGVWLDDRELRTIISHREQHFTPEQIEAVKAELQAHHTGAESESQLPCPKCQKVMTKVESSGVLIDRCPQRDGVWLDNGELEKLQILAEQRQTVFDAEAKREIAATHPIGLTGYFMGTVVDFFAPAEDLPKEEN